MRNQYTTVSIRKTLAAEIDRVVEAGFFNNRPDFFREAIRAHIRRFKGEQKNECKQ